MSRCTALSKLPLDQLRNVAARCGINRSGTKAALSQRIHQGLQDHVPLASDARVLSVDLGIRNLAYSLLRLPPPGPTLRIPAIEKNVFPTPIVQAWDVLSLGPATDDIVPGERASHKGTPRDSSPQVPSDDFSPQSISSIALRLVRERFLPLKPTHVLIERQRFRSAGGPAIYEWTVRVNSLEAMLYATLNTLRSLDHWDGSVIPIDPKRVGTFLLGDPKVADQTIAEPGVQGEADLGVKKARRATKEDGSKTRKNSKEIKKQKIDLLGNWLLEDEILMANPEVASMGAAFLNRWRPNQPLSGAKARSTASTLKETARTIKKLDDPADSLLQGIAWLRWEDNKTRLKSEYADELLP